MKLHCPECDELFSLNACGINLEREYVCPICDGEVEEYEAEDVASDSLAMLLGQPSFAPSFTLDATPVYAPRVNLLKRQAG